MLWTLSTVCVYPFKDFTLLYICIAEMTDPAAKRTIMYGEHAASPKEMPLNKLLIKAASGNPAQVRMK